MELSVITCPTHLGESLKKPCVLWCHKCSASGDLYILAVAVNPPFGLWLLVARTAVSEPEKHRHPPEPDTQFLSRKKLPGNALLQSAPLSALPAQPLSLFPFSFFTHITHHWAALFCLYFAGNWFGIFVRLWLCSGLGAFCFIARVCLFFGDLEGFSHLGQSSIAALGYEEEGKREPLWGLWTLSQIRRRGSLWDLWSSGSRYIRENVVASQRVSFWDPARISLFGKLW